MENWGPIVAATDFSPLARHAAERAARIARDTGVPLTLMHVLSATALQDLRKWLGATHAMARKLPADTRRELKRLAVELGAPGHVPVRAVHAVGAVAAEVVREAEAIDAALVVLGARGAGFLRHLLLGTTSERLLQRTTRPLLVVRHPPHEPYRRVLLAVDFSPWSLRVVAVARHVAPHAHFVLMNAFQVPFEEKLRFAGVEADIVDHYRRSARTSATRRVHALAKRAGLRTGQWQALVVEGEASTRIVEHERQQACDLVVLGKHGQSVTEDLLLGSVTRHVLAEGQADVLVSTAHEG